MYSIDKLEFMLIFNYEVDEIEYKRWDINDNGSIDSFILFTGIILSSDSNPEDIYKQLFSLYDLNNNDCLFFDNLSFLIENAFDSLLIMYEYKFSYSIVQIEKHLINNSYYFLENKKNTKFNITDFKRFIINDPYVKEFLYLFNVPPLIVEFQDVKYITSNTKKYNLTSDNLLFNPNNLNFESGYNMFYDFFNDLINIDYFDYSHKNSLLCFNTDVNLSNNFNTNTTYELPLFNNINYKIELEYKNYINWITKTVRDTTVFKDRLLNDLILIIDFNLAVNWIYGINIEGCAMPIQYLFSYKVCYKEEYKEDLGNIIKSSDNTSSYPSGYIIVYSVGKVVILFNTKNNTQCYYISHKYKVNCICVSDSDNIVASSDLAYKPAIHIWKYSYRSFVNRSYQKSDIKTLNILKGYHEYGVHLMKFSKNNKYLITCGLKIPSAVLIYDWRNNIICYSFNIKDSITQNLTSIAISQYSKKISNLTKENKINDEINSEFINNKHNKYFKYLFDNNLDNFIEFYCIVSGSSNINILKIIDSKFEIIKMPENEDIKSYINCSLLIKSVRNIHDIQENNEFNEDYNNNIGNFFNYNYLYDDIILITGHTNGDVCLWSCDKNNLGYISKIYTIY